MQNNQMKAEKSHLFHFMKFIMSFAQQSCGRNGIESITKSVGNFKQSGSSIFNCWTMFDSFWTSIFFSLTFIAVYQISVSYELNNANLIKLIRNNITIIVLLSFRLSISCECILYIYCLYALENESKTKNRKSASETCQLFRKLTQINRVLCSNELNTSQSKSNGGNQADQIV